MTTSDQDKIPPSGHNEPAQEAERTATALAFVAPSRALKRPKETVETREMVEFKRSTVRRTKNLFLLFLRQFDTREFEIVAKFLRVLLEKHKQEPLKMFGKNKKILSKISKNQRKTKHKLT